MIPWQIVCSDEVAHQNAPYICCSSNTPRWYYPLWTLWRCARARRAKWVCARVTHLPKRNQSSLLFLHSIMVARTASATSSSTWVSASRQHISTARFLYTSVTHTPAHHTHQEYSLNPEWINFVWGAKSAPFSHLHYFPASWSVQQWLQRPDALGLSESWRGRAAAACSVCSQTLATDWTHTYIKILCK